MLRSPHFCPMKAQLIDVTVLTLGGLKMGLPVPTVAELLELVEMHFAERRKTAERSRTDGVMTRQELIKHGWLPDRYVN